MLNTLQNIAKDLTGFKVLERVLAVICMIIPAILLIVDNQSGVRSSISDYVVMPNAHIFGSLLTIASLLFIVNGAVHIQTANIKKSKIHGRWYNIILGIFLLGVTFFDMHNFPGLHYGCAVAFFSASALVIALFNDKEHRKTSILLAFGTLLGFIIYFYQLYFNKIPILDWYNLFYAEWTSLIVIGIHYILESLNKIS